HQEYTADEDLTGWENIILCGKLYGLPRQDARKRADELLRLVDLHDAKDRKVQTYSGGMRRRLELACGLVNQPRLLFLDEPTLGLDVQTRVAIWSYIRALKKEYDMTILMTTHYMEEADGACDRIAIIDHGKIVKIGAPSELKASLGGDIIELKIDDNPADISDAIASLKDIKEVRKEGNLYRIKVVDGERIIPELINTTSRMGLEVARVSLLKPTLDEVYLEYTGRSLRQEQEDWENVFRHRMIMKKARA
ncbi:MAG: ATP-binding cassette domain-containing protein, partial [Candidatus Bathyarchaeia archaeon]